jgi:hypothetical protein
LILAKPRNQGTYGGVKFQVQLPLDQLDLLGLRLESNENKLPSVGLTPDYAKDIGNGWSEVYVPMEQLNPDGYDVIDRIIFHSKKPASANFVAIDNVMLTKPIPRNPIRYDPAALVQAPISIDCGAPSNKISPFIYGFAFYPFTDQKNQDGQWAIKGTIRRWGGNATSTYNWEAEAWNTGNDWFFENHAISHNKYLDENAEHGIPGAVTIPMMGWVAKDATSHSFPVSTHGPQEAVDTYRPDAGNGKGKDGKPIKPGPQTQAYKGITPEFVKRWIESIRQRDVKTGKRSVWMYILDNEPMIWNATHRDAHPEPLSYDELLSRTIEYGTAIRQADPDAVIAGPAEWGWTNYMYSAKDMAMGGQNIRIDRRSHGDLPVIAYYLKALAEHEKRTGVRILDVLDLHAYPNGNGVYGAKSDPETAALRLRSTRMLWDPSYVDESWVKEPINLLPRMKEWVATYYPGRGISLGEWNFGGDRHMSGALATAEALGRFAQFGLISAFFWAFPEENTPPMWGFRAYRDFDGIGSRFQDWYTPTTTPAEAPISVFASRNENGSRLVAIALNFDLKKGIGAFITMKSCGVPKSIKAFTYDAHSNGFIEGSSPQISGNSAAFGLPPYSITVFDVQLDNGTAPIVR